MRIRELLEGKDFNDLDFVRKDNDETVLDYDLIEDLTFFLNNNDDIYRRLVYPAVNKCVKSHGQKLKTSPAIFKQAVLEGYKEYIKEFPIRQLPNDLDEELCNEVCSKMHEDVYKDISEGLYKD
jgi:exoribonuclease II